MISACLGFQHSPISRRRLLQVGGLGLLGLSLPRLAHAANRGARAGSVIFLHQFGGPSCQDTFDMKPDAPDAIRGEFRPIASRAPGVHVCERLPRIAGVMDKVTLIRSLRHEMKNHNSAGYYSLTGYAPPTDDQRLRDSQDLFPAYGSVVDALAPARAGTPTFVSYPYVIADGSVTPGQTASFLGKAHDPLFIGQDPNTPDFRMPELSLPDNLTTARLADRRAMMRLVDEQSALLDYSARARGIDESYAKALNMLLSSGVKQAFDLSAEPAALRDRYGRTTYGQGCLLARRLVEAGRGSSTSTSRRPSAAARAAGTPTASEISCCDHFPAGVIPPVGYNLFGSAKFGRPLRVGPDAHETKNSSGDRPLAPAPRRYRRDAQRGQNSLVVAAGGLGRGGRRAGYDHLDRAFGDDHRGVSVKADVALRRVQQRFPGLCCFSWVRQCSSP